MNGRECSHRRSQGGDHGDESRPSLSYTEEKLNTTKIIAANNTPGTHPWSDHPSGKNAGLHAQNISLNIAQKRLAAGLGSLQEEREKDDIPLL